MSESTHTTPDVISLHALLAGFVQENISHVAMEVSSHGLEQGRVDGCDIDAAILTNLTRDHLDYHGSIENYKLAKLKLFTRPGIKTIVLNLDDAFSKEILSKIGIEEMGHLFTTVLVLPLRILVLNQVQNITIMLGAILIGMI